MAAPNRIYIQVDFQQAGAVAGVNQLNKAISSIGPTTQKASQQASQGISSLSLTVQQAQRSLAGIGSALAGIGAIRIGKDMLDTAMSFERARIGLEALTGSAAAGKKVFSELQAYAMKSPFELKELLAAETRLLAMRFSAEESIPALKAVSAAMGAIGGENAVSKMGDLITALGQIKAAGRVTGEEMRQLRNAGIPALDLLAKGFGTTTAKIQKMITDGLVPADKAIKILVEGMQKEFGKFEDMVSGTASVALSNFRDAWGQFADKLIRDYLPKLTAFLKDYAIPALDKFSKVINENKEAIVALGYAIAAFMAGKAIWSFGRFMGSIGGGLLKAAEGIKAAKAARDAALGAGSLAEAGAFAGGASAAGLLGLGAGTGIAATVASWKQLSEHMERVNAEAEKLKFTVDQLDVEKLAMTDEPWKRGIKGWAEPRGWGPAPWDQFRLKKAADKIDQLDPTEAQIAAALRRKKMITDLVRDMNDTLRDAYADRLKITDQYMTEEQQQAAEITASRIQMMREYQKRFYTIDEKTGDLTKITARNPQEAQQLMDAYVKFTEQMRVREAAINDKWDIARRDKALENIKETAAQGFEIYVDYLDLEGKAFFASMDLQKEYREKIQDDQLQADRRRLDARRDIALAQLEGYDAQTLEQQIALSQERMRIEDEHLQKSLAISLEILSVEQKRSLALMDQKALLEGQMSVLGMMTPAYAAARAEAVKSQTANVQNLVDETQEKRDLNRLQAVTHQAQLVRSELQKTFEYFQNLAEGVFDALLGKSKSVAQAMADFLKTTMLTMIKAIYTNAIAAGMMRMFGLPVPQQAGNPVLRMLTGGGMGGGTGGGFSPASMFANTGIAMGGTGTPGSGSSGGLMSYASTAGSLGGLGRMLGLGGMGSWGAKWVPAAMRGPIGAGVPGALNYGTNATNMAWTGATSGIAGGGGLTAALAGMGLFNTGSIAMGAGSATTAAGIGGLGGALAGFASSPGGILAGLALLGYGAKRGGKAGAVMTTGGGALAGFGIGAMIGSVGGPIGMGIGAAVGGVIGLIGLLRKSAEEKTRERIKAVYGVSIDDNKLLQQIVQIAKDQYGGNINLAIFTPQVRDLILNYKMTQSATGEGRPMYPVSFALSGGQLHQQPVWNGGGIVQNPYSGPTTTQVNSMPVYVQLNPQQANDLFEGKVVAVIDANPEAVANSSVKVAGDSTYRRQSAQNAILEPLTLLN